MEGTFHYGEAKNYVLLALINLLKTVYNIIGMSVSKSLLMDLCVGQDRLSVF